MFSIKILCRFVYSSTMFSSSFHFLMVHLTLFCSLTSALDHRSLFCVLYRWCVELKWYWVFGFDSFYTLLVLHLFFCLFSSLMFCHISRQWSHILLDLLMGFCPLQFLAFVQYIFSCQGLCLCHVVLELCQWSSCFHYVWDENFVLFVRFLQSWVLSCKVVYIILYVIVLHPLVPSVRSVVVLCMLTVLISPTKFLLRILVEQGNDGMQAFTWFFKQQNGNWF